jgi:hypothetical protein
MTDQMAISMTKVAPTEISLNREVMANVAKDRENI